MLYHLCQCARAIPKLMAYMALIVSAIQDYQGLAWARYDASFRRQAAPLEIVPKLNTSMYALCLTGNAQMLPRSELCLDTSHTTKDCALQGDRDPNMQARVKAVESAIVAMSSKPTGQRGVGGSAPPQARSAACSIRTVVPFPIAATPMCAAHVEGTTQQSRIGEPHSARTRMVNRESTRS